MAGRWNKNWTRLQKDNQNETNRRKYALKRLKEGKSYRRKDSVVYEEVDVTEAMKVLASAVRKKLVE